MGRPAIATPETVRKAYEELRQAGQEPTVDRIRHRIGGGSDGTIGPMLRNLRREEAAAVGGVLKGVDMEVRQEVQKVLSRISRDVDWLRKVVGGPR